MDMQEISTKLQAGKAKEVKALVQQAIDEGIPAQTILTEGLLKGMDVVGEKFKNNEIFVPEVLVAARAMNMGVALLKPLLAAQGVKASGKVCIGTVQGDLHDIGKNLVKMMMEGKGLEVVDLGTDVSPETFVRTAKEQNCQVICCSADDDHGRHGRGRQGGRARGNPRQGQDHGRRRARDGRLRQVHRCGRLHAGRGQRRRRRRAVLRVRG